MVGDFVEMARKLQKEYPEQVLAYYMSGLGDLRRTMSRKQCALKAEVLKKVRHMWVEFMKKPDEWRAFAGKVKRANEKRAAFQEECSHVIPGWADL